jgi:hypothetical protein
MEKTLKVINELERKGIIKRYAIGGGIAALFYMEPILTYDLDVFVFLPEAQDTIISISPIYEFLRERGCKVHQDHVMIEGVPVQFIPAYNDLVEEAVKEAREVKYKRTKTRVLPVEYLLAIMFQTNRPKDRTRISQLLEEAEMDPHRLSDVLQAHGLQKKWDEFKRRFHGN